MPIYSSEAWILPPFCCRWRDCYVSWGRLDFDIRAEHANGPLGRLPDLTWSWPRADDADGKRPVSFYGFECLRELTDILLTAHHRHAKLAPGLGHRHRHIAPHLWSHFWRGRLV